MRIKSVHLENYKRFTDLTISGISESARLVVMLGPNGSGKSSVFDAFLLKSLASKNNWSLSNNQYFEYFIKDETTSANFINTNQVARNVNIGFDRTIEDWSKIFNIRTAYRHEPDFSNASFGPVKPAHESSRFQRIIDQDQAVSDDFSRLGRNALSNVLKGGSRSLDQFVQDILGELKASLEHLFEEPRLSLQDLGTGVDSGAFRFEKGDAKDFHYKNLSGGEKAAFDLLLDIFVKRGEYQDAIYCIDEPESHLASAIHGQLLEAMLSLIPAPSQLWIATHSTGFVRKAVELSKQGNDVAFLDFSGRDFDQPVEFTPSIPNQHFFRKMYDVLQEDLAGLVAPARIVICEGKKSPEGTDAKLYNGIFGESHPDTLFVSRGGASEVENSDLRAVLPIIVPQITVRRLIDRDDMTPTARDEKISKGIQVLNRRELENYLWSTKVVRKALQDLQIEDATIDRILLEHQPDEIFGDIKDSAGCLFGEIRRELKGSGKGPGNTRDQFALEYLVPALRETEEVYRELQSDVFPD